MIVKISSRMEGLEESVTLAVTAKAKELKARGYDIIGFGAGEPDFDTPENIKKAAVKAIEKGYTKYTPVGGIDALKDAIIGKFKKDNGLDYSKEEILVSCGGKHSLFNLFQALLEAGDEVIIPSPYWVSYPPMVKLAGGMGRIVKTDEETGFKMTPEEFKKNITKKTKAVIINSPSNPTGSVYAGDELAKIVEIALEKRVFIISDEIYEKLYYGDKPITCAASLSEKARQNSIIINGVSKTYAMTGWRIGYAAGPKELIKAMTNIQSQSTSNPASISQWAAVEALAGPQDKVKTMVEEFKRRRALMVAGLNSIEGVSCMTPQGAFYVFANVSSFFGKRYGDRKIDGSLAITSFFLEEAEVAVVPGIAFGDDGHIRLSYACSEEDIRLGLSRMKEALGKLK